MSEITHTKLECPFCLGNGLFKGEILAKSPGAYLAENHFNPGSYLIIPLDHVESPLKLSDTWWAEVKELLPKVLGLDEHYNISLNFGSHAGQSVKHLHFWIVPRFSGKPSSGKGLARLISEADTAQDRQTNE